VLGPRRECGSARPHGARPGWRRACPPPCPSPVSLLVSLLVYPLVYPSVYPPEYPPEYPPDCVPVEDSLVYPSAAADCHSAANPAACPPCCPPPAGAAGAAPLCSLHLLQRRQRQRRQRRRRRDPSLRLPPSPPLHLPPLLFPRQQQRRLYQTRPREPRLGRRQQLRRCAPLPAVSVRPPHPLAHARSPVWTPPAARGAYARV